MQICDNVRNFFGWGNADQLPAQGAEGAGNVPLVVNPLLDQQDNEVASLGDRVWSVLTSTFDSVKGFFQEVAKKIHDFVGYLMSFVIVAQDNQEAAVEGAENAEGQGEVNVSDEFRAEHEEELTAAYKKHNKMANTDVLSEEDMSIINTKLAELEQREEGGTRLTGANFKHAFDRKA